MLNFEEFPLLIPQDDTGKVYEGYLTMKNEDYKIKIKIQDGGDLRHTVVETEWKIQVIINQYWPILKKRLAQCNNLGSFLKDLVNIVENELKQEDLYSNCSLIHYLVQQLQTIGWNRLKSIDTSFEKVILVINDYKDRQHLLKLHFNSQNLSAEPKCQSDLPNKFLYHWNKQNGLKSLVHQFEESLKQYEEFWDEMEEIDSNTWILDPEQPRFNCAYRRIVIGPNVSIQINVDAKQPRNFPECIFLGADQLINPLKEKLNENLLLWDLNKSLLSNLETVLDVTFPSPTNSKKEDFSVECGICYAYKLELSTPDIVCDDKRCSQAFHQHCLYEWLRSLPSSRQSFNTIYGECPFCNKVRSNFMNSRQLV
ncbi:hypothetical protein LOTGIDRAFT_118527 [Lottia gigantea]|uniref:RING-type domain-containing protein n=1 Tax=Lottia gigantea TaxID=225164 RepID=V4AG87_LOTGI|nr:hypothetical protein LOTGIDRAFT_118527 [Lottia gigantea]ESO94180.1 hypothetical protein LOTGIDRAFT_118527 [Lottia gigantea]